MVDTVATIKKSAGLLENLKKKYSADGSFTDTYYESLEKYVDKTEMGGKPLTDAQIEENRRRAKQQQPEIQAVSEINPRMKSNMQQEFDERKRLQAEHEQRKLTQWFPELSSQTVPINVGTPIVRRGAEQPRANVNNSSPVSEWEYISPEELSAKKKRIMDRADLSPLDKLKLYKEIERKNNEAAPKANQPLSEEVYSNIKLKDPNQAVRSTDKNEFPVSEGSTPLTSDQRGIILNKYPILNNVLKATDEGPWKINDRAIDMFGNGDIEERDIKKNLIAIEEILPALNNSRSVDKYFETFEDLNKVYKHTSALRILSSHINKNTILDKNSLQSLKQRIASKILNGEFKQSSFGNIVANAMKEVPVGATIKDFGYYLGREFMSKIGDPYKMPEQLTKDEVYNRSNAFNFSEQLRNTMGIQTLISPSRFISKKSRDSDEISINYNKIAETKYKFGLLLSDKEKAILKMNKSMDDIDYLEIDD